MKKEISLAGKRALITGGGAGIGWGIAKEMHDAGATVMLVGRRADVLAKAAAELETRVETLAADITDTAALPALAARVEESGPIDILVNNAGINLKKPFDEFTEEDYDRITAVQQKAAFFLTQAVAQGMKARQSGVVLFISSLSARIGMQKNQPYTMCKGGIVALARSLMAELAPYGIRVNSINPGYILTDMIKAINKNTPERMETMQKATPLGRFGTVEDIGMAAAFLASDAAAFITGVDLVVDGGHSNASIL